HDRDHALPGSLPRCGENRTNLGRMMGVIVDDDRTVDLPDAGEAAFDSLKTFESSNNCVVRNAELQSDCNRREGVLDVMASRDGYHQFDRPPLAVATEDHGIKARSTRDRSDIVGAHIGKRGEA